MEAWEHGVSTSEERAPMKRAPRGLSLARRELELVGRAKEGDLASLRELLVGRFGFLHDEMQSRLPPSQWDAVQGYDWLSAMLDVAADTIRSAEPTNETRMQAWLAQVADLALRLHYREAIEFTTPSEPWTWGSDETPDSLLSELACGADDARDERELRGDIRQCMDGLAEDERVLVHVRDYVGASWEAIADTLGYRSPQHARAEHLLVLRKLAELMQRRRVG
jgi:DNA-directed RNA polymerase specialized sigma24 family protein